MKKEKGKERGSILWEEGRRMVYWVYEATPPPPPGGPAGPIQVSEIPFSFISSEFFQQMSFGPFSAKGEQKYHLLLFLFKKI
jgi:hypothetical protein